jgi:uncharacterized protein (TIGR01777 family)
MKKVLISGGTGLIGTALTRLLQSKGYQVAHLSRSSGEKNGVKAWKWDYKKKILEPGAMEGVYAIVHLAGAGIADKRWTDARKKEIIDSRVETAGLLYQALKNSGSNPTVFVSASGINYYGSISTEKVFVESDPPSDSFIGECCRKWEAAADLFAPICRVVKLRTGVVLSPKGGALEKISLPVKYGFGAALGSGKQYMPYIHIDDLAQMYLAAIEDEQIQGAYNASNGDHITNSQLTKEIAAALKRPLWLPNVPGFAMKLALGELSEILLEGSRASADKIKATGFSFQHPDIRTALGDIYKNT